MKLTCWHGLRCKGVPMPGWIADLTGALLVLVLLAVLLSALWELIRGPFHL